MHKWDRLQGFPLREGDFLLMLALGQRGEGTALQIASRSMPSENGPHSAKKEVSMRSIILLLTIMATFTNLTACTSLLHTPGAKEDIKPHAGRRVLKKAWPDKLNVASSNVVFLDRAEALVDQGVYYVGPGPAWPMQYAWKPRSFYGPWFAGSNLDAIQLTLKRNLVPTWYYTTYFDDITGVDLQIYSQYIPGITTSMAAPPDYSRIPGLTPTQPSANTVQLTDIYLSLNEIHLSSKYGGSVELVFRSHENVEFEIRKGNTLWDSRTLQIRIFATPKTNQMNPLAPQTAYNTFDPLNVELEAIDPTEYSITTINNETYFIPQASVNNQELMQALELITAAIELNNNLRLQANQFIHAWLHVEHQQLIDRTASPPERVDAIEISDNFLDMKTSAREPWFTWFVQVVQLDAPHLHHFKISIMHDYYGTNPIRIWNSVETLHPREASRLIRAGHFLLANCDSLEQVNVEISVRDFHPPQQYPALLQVWNDIGLLTTESEGTRVALAVLDVVCNDLRTFEASIRPGAAGAVSPDVVLFEQQEADVTLMDSDWDSHGNYTLKARLLITYR